MNEDIEWGDDYEDEDDFDPEREYVIDGVLVNPESTGNIPRKFNLPIEVLATANPITPTGKLSEYGEQLRMDGVEYVVYHNVTYGCTSELAVWELDLFRDGYRPYGSPCITTVRDRSGCGSAEIANMHSAVEHRVICNHLLLTKVFPEPGAKFVHGVASYKHAEDFGWAVGLKFDDPHSNWSGRTLFHWHLLHKPINDYMTERKPVIPKYAYFPAEWAWRIDHALWNTDDYGRLTLALPYGWYSNADLRNIPYLKDFCGEKTDPVRKDPA